MMDQGLNVASGEAGFIGSHLGGAFLAAARRAVAMDKVALDNIADAAKDWFR
ncbi:MAG: hypothetical protein PW843_00505 [Azospirillaceae bacterium]|nr:hypothetical protein [Azospirillaceae bacterium]